MTDINDTLIERESTHGDYQNVAETAQRIKHIFRSSRRWQSMPDYMKEALEHVATKLARVLNGDFNFIDAWRDVGGYSELVIKQLHKSKRAKDVEMVYTELTTKEGVNDE